MKKKNGTHHQEDKRAADHERIEQNWKNRMDSKHKKMSRGAENLAKILKTRTSYGTDKKD